MVSESTGRLPLEEKILAEQLRPSAEEREYIRGVADRLLAAIKESGKAEGMVVGSIARNTWVKGDRDLDVFMVAITPAAGFVTPLTAVLIGAVAGVLSFVMMLWRIRRQLDESLDAWAIHGMSGLWGTLATGLFAAAAVAGFSGLFEGNLHQMVANTVAAFAAMIFAFVMTYIVAWVIDRTMGLRVSPDEEYVGLDICQYGERA